MQKVLNTKKLSELIANSITFQLSKIQAEQFFNVLVDLMTSELKNGTKIKINRFGSFEVKDRKGRKCVDPRDNLTEMFVPTVAVVKFKSSYTLKNKIRGRNYIV